MLKRNIQPHFYTMILFASLHFLLFNHNFNHGFYYNIYAHYIKVYIRWQQRHQLQVYRSVSLPSIFSYLK
jgi:hypothetical protein